MTDVATESPSIDVNRAGRYVYVAAVFLLCAWVIDPPSSNSN